MSIIHCIIILNQTIVNRHRFYFILCLTFSYLTSSLMAENKEKHSAINDEQTIVFECITNHYALPGTKMMHRYRTNQLSDKIIVSELPKGLVWDTKRKVVEGKIEKPGQYSYKVTAKRKSRSVSTDITVNVSADLISPTPLMGWMSWNIFQDQISEQNIKAVADLLVSTGLRDAGFDYVLIDDHWHADVRDENGNPVEDLQKFPSGMKSLVDYIHSKGLKAGIYSDAAPQTCGGEFGSLGYETIDAKKYAEWGFDFLKYDYCGAPNDMEIAKERYKKMSDALKATGMNFYFNICEWGERKPWLWAANAGGHSWRVSFDSRDTWDHGKYDGSHCGVIQSIDIMKNLDYYAGPNQFNDADMMCVGLYGKGKPSSASGARGMTDTEYQSQFSLWCMFATPLLISFDLSTINKATLDILTNGELIAINQDRLGQQARCVYSHEGHEIYLKDLENGDIAIAILNRNNTKSDFNLKLADINLKSRYKIRDIVAKSDAGILSKTLKASISSHEAKVYRIRKLK